MAEPWHNDDKTRRVEAVINLNPIVIQNLFFVKNALHTLVD